MSNKLNPLHFDSSTCSIDAKIFWETAQDVVVNLFERWLDEHEYEDINDYRKPLDPIAKQTGVTITKMTKRPFGCHFTVKDGRVYQLSMNAKGDYQYRRIA